MGGIPCPVCEGGFVGRHCPPRATWCEWGTCSRCRANIVRVTGRHDHPPHAGDTCKTCGPIERSTEKNTWPEREGK